jgi:hypothetical protein
MTEPDDERHDPFLGTVKISEEDIVWRRPPEGERIVERVADIMMARLDLNGHTLDGIKRTAEAIVAAMPTALRIEDAPPVVLEDDEGIYAAMLTDPSSEQEVLVGEARKASAWLRECSTWLLETDLDMTCPMQTDPLDIADDLDAALAKMEASNAD